MPEERYDVVVRAVATQTASGTSPDAGTAPAPDQRTDTAGDGIWREVGAALIRGLQRGHW